MPPMRGMGWVWTLRRSGRSTAPILKASLMARGLARQDKTKADSNTVIYKRASIKHKPSNTLLGTF